MPRRIVVEVRKDPIASPPLVAIAEVCRALGHDVILWRGPLSGRMPYSRWLPTCDLAVLFNGAHRSYRPALARLRSWGVPTLFVELGWHPQALNYQIDFAGVNCAASWVAEPLEAEAVTKLPVRSQGDLLVPLQLDGDTQITERSPYFANMLQFVQFLGRHSQLPVRLRPHPKAQLSASARNELTSSGAHWDDGATLAESLERCRAVACINSSSALEAIAGMLPVLCYGEAIYRHPNAVYCLDDLGESTARVTAQLARGECELYTESLNEVVARVQQQQWTIERVWRDMPELIERSLLTSPAPRPRFTPSDRIERAFCWLTDMPARVLYRKRLQTPSTSIRAAS